MYGKYGVSRLVCNNITLETIRKEQFIIILNCLNLLQTSPNSPNILNLLRPSFLVCSSLKPILQLQSNLFHHTVIVKQSDGLGNYCKPIRKIFEVMAMPIRKLLGKHLIHQEHQINLIANYTMNRGFFLLLQIINLS